MNDLQRRIARARLLRREGKTYDEIRAALDFAVSDNRLREWLRGIPRPRSTHRSRAKTALRTQARRLRAQGLSYDEIAVQLRVSKSSLSLWLRGQPGRLRRPYDQGEHLARIQPMGAAARRARAAAERFEIHQQSALEVGSVAGRDLFMLGTALYWAEGSKSKPWHPTERVVFVNSDPGVICVFLAWLEMLGIGIEEMTFRVQIHESADTTVAVDYWAAVCSVERAVFKPSTLKRHNPKTRRGNVSASYRGCLRIEVRKSARLYKRIDGWWQALVSQTCLMVHTETATDPP